MEEELCAASQRRLSPLGKSGLHKGEEHMSRGNGERILWFVVGVGIGTGATFLFGTREGRKVRRQVARMMEDGCDQITEAGREAIDKGKELLDEGRGFVKETGARIGRELHVARR